MRNVTILAPVITTIMIVVFYVASPLLAAHKLREAVRTGDTPTIERMIVWQSFRESVRHTVIHNANLLPLAQEAARTVQPTVWQRIRSVFGHSLLDRFMERYISPHGLPELYRAKTKWHERRNGAPEESSQTSVVPNRIARAWKRIKRAEFTTPFQFVLETEDPHTAERLIRSTFQLTNAGLSGFDWKLIAISVRTSSTPRSNFARLNAF